jgi:hypothetical protein
VTEIYRGGTLVVWFYESGDGRSTGPVDKAVFAGQDLGGYPGASEYEYWFYVEASDLRRALGIGDGDLTAAVKARGEEIVRAGERGWLEDHGIEYRFDNRIEWE